MSRFAGRAGPIRLGMVGGGQGAFIGAVHRIAARMDGHFELVAGALSSTPETARESGAALGLAPDRIYDDFETMARREARLKDGIEAVAIVTPNHLHFAPARAFLRRGIHVICDKPMTATGAEAKKLAAEAAKSDALFVLTHNYSGYPMIRQARAMVAEGFLGRLRGVQVEYVQDWLATPVESQGSKQAEWRTDPARSGAGGALGDIGTHAFQLAAFVTGEAPEAVSADLTSFVTGRRLDDDARVLLRYASGAKGALWCSQVAPGNENRLTLRVYGEDGGLEWSQENPERLVATRLGEAPRLMTRAVAGPEATRLQRVPSGHPEGYLEAFANLYAEAAAAIRAAREGAAAPAGTLFPDVGDGLAGLRFVEACVASAKRDGRWTALS
ncbi:Gfo/Idh/MocA family oxidoreductase [Albimonas sp. CAU 1670]|uniref:Gfo/Idh/MocA family protein n=1 Tax=Albimonas sp. CAU 1670 TaxID=3032599 RepID=UPI0023DC38E0|nr:Gfo/Idh/MocA family oxidoreductase [Albimonas sp. CAU 1670]MDF2235794.1 Gfo/Idh/MocA family oxidoreductase [Albimonas sp. CAU 1670]